MPNSLVVCKLGSASYRPVWELQRKLQTRLIKAKREEPFETLPHILLLVEHPHVYTLGKSGNPEHLLANDNTLAQRDAEFVEVDRGGDITYHGPGQLVGYPILDLDRIFTDLHRYLRALEDVIIQTCSQWNVKGFRVDGRTGVWVGDKGVDERKICAYGVRCSRWVTMHGWALNVYTDLSYFDHIVPCGITDRGVTSLSAEVINDIEMEEVEHAAIDAFIDRFGLDATILSVVDTREYLSEIVPNHDLEPLIRVTSRPHGS